MKLINSTPHTIVVAYILHTFLQDNIEMHAK